MAYRAAIDRLAKNSSEQELERSKEYGDAVHDLCEEQVRFFISQVPQAKHYREDLIQDAWAFACTIRRQVQAAKSPAFYLAESLANAIPRLYDKWRSVEFAAQDGRTRHKAIKDGRWPSVTSYGQAAHSAYRSNRPWFAERAGKQGRIRYEPPNKHPSSATPEQEARANETRKRIVAVVADDPKMVAAIPLLESGMPINKVAKKVKLDRGTISNKLNTAWARLGYSRRERKHNYHGRRP